MTITSRMEALFSRHVRFLAEWGPPPTEDTIAAAQPFIERVEGLLGEEAFLASGMDQDVSAEWWVNELTIAYFHNSDGTFLLYVIYAADKPALVDEEEDFGRGLIALRAVLKRGACEGRLSTSRACTAV